MTMHTYRDYPTDTREGEPRAAKFVLCADHQWLTFADTCHHDASSEYVRYGVIGTDYGHLHNSSGGWRLWSSPSSAYRAARDHRKA